MKTFEPATVVIDRTNPVGTHKTMQTMIEMVSTPDGMKKTRVRKAVAFPVFRGVDASHARYMRSQARRARRLMMREDSVSMDSMVFSAHGGGSDA